MTTYFFEKLNTHLTKLMCVIKQTLMACQHAPERTVFVDNILDVINRDRKHWEAINICRDFIEVKIDDKRFISNVKVLIRLDRFELRQQWEIPLCDLLLD